MATGGMMSVIMIEGEDTVDLGETPTQGRSREPQTGTLFSHQIQLEPGASLQRLVRYLRETRTAGTESS